MITEDYCSYEVAKLLKEKGFDGLCYCHEFTDYEGNSTTYHTKYPENWNQSEPCVSIPTLGMAMKWLREKGVYFSLVPFIENVGWPKDTWHINFYNYDGIMGGGFPVKGYEKAVESAIKYCLENLI